MIEQVVSIVRNKKNSMKNHLQAPDEIITIAASSLQTFLDADLRAFHIQELYERKFSCDIYRVTANLSSIVVAQDEKKNCYWLDSYGSDEDFGRFVSLEYRNGTLQPLVEDVVLISQFLVDTKLNYMLLPVFVSRFEDIPSISDMGSNSDISVLPPQIEQLSEDLSVVSFSVWTRLFGYLLNINCNIGFEEFTHTASTVARGIGNYARHL